MTRDQAFAEAVKLFPKSVSVMAHPRFKGKVFLTADDVDEEGNPVVLADGSGRSWAEALANLKADLAASGGATGESSSGDGNA